jgi:hypothetical protein
MTARGISVFCMTHAEGKPKLSGGELGLTPIAVFPANVHMLWLRLPLQLPLLWWVWRAAARPRQ